jgi:hypothetical protein
MINCNDTCTNNDFEESKTPEESFKRKRCEDFKIYIETKSPQFTSDLSAGANDKDCEKSYWTKCYGNKDNSYKKRPYKKCKYTTESRGFKKNGYKENSNKYLNRREERFRDNLMKSKSQLTKNINQYMDDDFVIT